MRLRESRPYQKLRVKLGLSCTYPESKVYVDNTYPKVAVKFCDGCDRWQVLVFHREIIGDEDPRHVPIKWYTEPEPSDDAVHARAVMSEFAAKLGSEGAYAESTAVQRLAAHMG